jgi:hypothetical protein
MVYGLGVGYRTPPSRPTLELSYEVAVHSYTQTDKWDRVSHNLQASFEQRLTRHWNLETNGELSFKGSSEDRELVDQYILLQQIYYRLNRQNRLGFYGAYRVKRYDDSPDRDATNLYLGGDFEEQLGVGHRWKIGYRYETNRPQSPRHQYIRWTYSMDYTTPLSARGKLILGVRYRSQRYDERLMEIEDTEVPRHDHRWVLSASWIRPLWRNQELDLDYKFETRSSNDPDKEFSAHLLAITLRHRW